MLNLKAITLSGALLASASATLVTENKTLVTHCASEVISYNFDKRLFREPKITQLFSVISGEWRDWCIEPGEWMTIKGSKATCERILQTNVRLERRQEDGRKITTLEYDLRFGDRYYPPGGSEALANIGDEDAQFVRYDRKEIDFALGSFVKRREQFLAPRGVLYTSAETALDDAYARTVDIYTYTSHQKKNCVL